MPIKKNNYITYGRLMEANKYKMFIKMVVSLVILKSGVV